MMEIVKHLFVIVFVLNILNVTKEEDIKGSSQEKNALEYTRLITCYYCATEKIKEMGMLIEQSVTKGRHDLKKASVKIFANMLLNCQKRIKESDIKSALKYIMGKQNLEGFICPNDFSYINISKLENPKLNIELSSEESKLLESIDKVLKNKQNADTSKKDLNEDEEEEEPRSYNEKDQSKNGSSFFQYFELLGIFIMNNKYYMIAGGVLIMVIIMKKIYKSLIKYIPKDNKPINRSKDPQKTKTN